MRSVALIRVRTVLYFALIGLLITVVLFIFQQKRTRQEQKKLCYQDMVTFCSRVETNIPDNGVVFIGDSQVHGLCVAAVTPNGVNLGIGGELSSGVLQRLRTYRSIHHVRAIVVAVGANDLIQGKQDGIAERFEEIIGLIPKTVPVVLSAIIPVDERITPKARNRNIYSVNLDIAKVCSKFKNCYYSDLKDLLQDASGNLSPRYHIGDGVHLNAQGNQIWIDALRHILRICSSNVDTFVK